MHEKFAEKFMNKICNVTGTGIKVMVRLEIFLRFRFYRRFRDRYEKIGTSSWIVSQPRDSKIYPRCSTRTVLRFRSKNSRKQPPRTDGHPISRFEIHHFKNDELFRWKLFMNILKLLDSFGCNCVPLHHSSNSDPAMRNGPSAKHFGSRLLDWKL